MRCSTTDIPVGVSLILARLNQRFLDSPGRWSTFITVDNAHGEMDVSLRKILLMPLPAILVLGALFAPQYLFAGTRITKCQDASGKWHYGDAAAQECEDSKWTALNSRGVVVDEKEVPPTAEELRKREAEAEKKKQEEQRKAREEAEWQRMLSVYDKEEFIIFARDTRLENLNAMIQVNHDLLKRLRENMEAYKLRPGKKAKAEAEKLQARIAAFEQDNLDKAAEKDRVVATYNELLRRFREAKKQIAAKEATR